MSITYDVIVVGSGAAGFNAANRIKKPGRKSVAIVTEGINSGTSRNTGSDKQTYYKLNLSSSCADSVKEMAQNLFDCGCVDGDIAFCEAASSAQCFLNLAELGVPFPKDEFGEYVGYKTDHDPYARASSAGPYTSKMMTEVLEKQAHALGVDIIDDSYVAKILVNENRVAGVCTVNTVTGKMDFIRCRYVVLATGGPAGIYADSVYPESQSGASSLALTAGAALQNMSEWQFGLASVSPKWNVSGSYMQALPRFVSVDENGAEYEFLSDYFESVRDALSAVFLKGYQWPFDANKASHGSSRIDIAVYIESKLRGRRIFLDYTKNPFGIDDITKDNLIEEAFIYLERAGASGNTPIERLSEINAPAVELYRDKGVELDSEMLEIALCAQHCNGGIAVDKWWESDVKGLFACGECAGTHGVTRPGGSALNSGQVGSLRAAEKISCDNCDFVEQAVFDELCKNTRDELESLLSSVLGDECRLNKSLNSARELFSKNCGAIRPADSFDDTRKQLFTFLEGFSEKAKITDSADFVSVLRFRDMLLTQLATVLSMKEFFANENTSRGSAVYLENPDNIINALSEIDSGNFRKDLIYQVKISENEFVVSIREVRPIPTPDICFENIWREYRQKNEGLT